MERKGSRISRARRELGLESTEAAPAACSLALNSALQAATEAGRAFQIVATRQTSLPSTQAHVGRVTNQRASSAGDLSSRLQQKVQALQGDPEEQQEETDVGLVIVPRIVSGRIADVEGFRRIACVEAYRVEPHEHRPDKFKHDWRKP